MGRLIRLALWASIGFLGWAGWIFLQPPKAVVLPYEFTVRPGQSLASVSRELAAQHGLTQPWLMAIYGRLSGAAARIKPGIYRVEQPSSPYTLLIRMAQGDSLRAKLTLIEGWNLREVRASLGREDYLAHDSAPLSDAELARRLGGPSTLHLEGLLFPDTYVVDAGASDLEVMRLAAEAMQNRLAAAWEKRAPNLPYRSPYEALIMASIVEKETGSGAERARIAAVFINRLRLGMPLQTDPSVIYGLGGRFDGNLRRADLRADTPYNTYTRRGLPPTPIAMPGAAAIAAALHPAPDKALYFVARGDGTHQFSSTLVEHNRAVAQYQFRPALKQRSLR